MTQSLPLGLAASGAGFGVYTVRRHPGVAGDIALDFAAGGAGLGGGTGSLRPGVAQRFPLGAAAAGTGDGGIAGGIRPDMTQSLPLGLAASGAGFRGGAGRVLPVVGQCFALGDTAGSTGLRRLTGGIRPSVTRRLAVYNAAGGAELGIGTGGVRPGVSGGVHAVCQSADGTIGRYAAGSHRPPMGAVGAGFPFGTAGDIDVPRRRHTVKQGYILHKGKVVQYHTGIAVTAHLDIDARQLLHRAVVGACHRYVLPRTVAGDGQYHPAGGPIGQQHTHIQAACTGGDGAVGDNIVHVFGGQGDQVARKVTGIHVDGVIRRRGTAVGQVVPKSQRLLFLSAPAVKLNAEFGGGAAPLYLQGTIAKGSAAHRGGGAALEIGETALPLKILGDGEERGAAQRAGTLVPGVGFIGRLPLGLAADGAPLGQTAIGRQPVVPCRRRLYRTAHGARRGVGAGGGDPAMPHRVGRLRNAAHAAYAGGSAGVVRPVVTQCSAGVGPRRHRQQIGGLQHVAQIHLHGGDAAHIHQSAVDLRPLGIDKLHPIARPQVYATQEGGGGHRFVQRNQLGAVCPCGHRHTGWVGGQNKVRIHFATHVTGDQTRRRGSDAQGVHAEVSLPVKVQRNRRKLG